MYALVSCLLLPPLQIRVTIFSNGDYTSGGKVFVLENIKDINDLMAKAQTKLGETTPFKRVYVDSGGEVSEGCVVVMMGGVNVMERGEEKRTRGCNISH